MIFGFNTEVRIGSNVFHVQTEDLGAQKHLIETTVYMGGRLVHRRKVSYEELLESPNFSETDVRARLEEQHRDVIEELRSGALTFETPAMPAKAAAKPEPPSAPAPVAPPAAKSAAPARRGAAPAGTSAAHATGARPASAPQAEPAPPAFAAAGGDPGAAQLLNPASWYAAGTATLKIDVKSKNSNEPLADAMLLVLIQSPTGPITFAAKSDSRGRVELVFPLPKMGPAGADVIIRTPGNSEDEIRYSLKPSSNTR
ncbi:MAG: hypothetical protein ACRD5G_11460 [Candidatus Acidiferrales bacterium]